MLQVAPHLGQSERKLSLLVLMQREATENGFSNFGGLVKSTHYRTFGDYFLISSLVDVNTRKVVLSQQHLPSPL